VTRVGGTGRSRASGRLRVLAGHADRRLRRAAATAAEHGRSLAARARSARSDRSARGAGSVGAGRLGKYVLERADDRRFRFTLQASNGHVIASSESYESHTAALHAIESVRRNAATTRVDDRTANADADPP
jgi:uncharacterized protein